MGTWGGLHADTGSGKGIESEREFGACLGQIVLFPMRKGVERFRPPHGERTETTLRRGKGNRGSREGKRREDRKIRMLSEDIHRMSCGDIAGPESHG